MSTSLSAYLPVRLSEYTFSAEDLRLKEQDLAEVKASYEEFVKSAKQMEDEMEAAMETARAKIERLSKKNKDTTAKFNDLTVDFNRRGEEIEELRRLLLLAREREQEDRRDAEEKDGSLALKAKALMSKNQELSSTIDQKDEEISNKQTEIDELYKLM